jgi:hypothetical protein
MIPPLKFNFNPTEMLNEMPQYVINGNTVKFNCPFTLPEVVFLCLAKETLQYTFKENVFLFAFLTSNEEKLRYENLTNRFKLAENYSPEKLRVENIISSIWGKIGPFLEFQLISAQNLKDLEEEKLWASLAKIKMLESISMVNNNFKTVFTNRQGQLLLAIANNLEKTLFNFGTSGA